MFTLNIYLRFALIGLFILGGLALGFVYSSFWTAFFFILIGLVLLISYFLLGTIQSAAQMVQMGQFEAAEQRLNLTMSPRWLYKTNRAFYYMIKGTLATQRQDHTEAEKWLLKAEEVELPTDNEKAMVALQLASIQANKGKWNNAKMHFKKLKGLKVTEPQLKDQIKQFEKALTNRGQMKHARTARGGKGGRYRKM